MSMQPTDAWCEMTTIIKCNEISAYCAASDMQLHACSENTALYLWLCTSLVFESTGQMANGGCIGDRS